MVNSFQKIVRTRKKTWKIAKKDELFFGRNRIEGVYDGVLNGLQGKEARWLTRDGLSRGMASSLIELLRHGKWRR